MGLVIITVMLIRRWYEYNVLNYAEEEYLTRSFYKYLPSSFNALFIIIFGAIYKKIAFILVDQENHRFEQDHENSLIQKMYIF